jgi:hypothetical protein
MTSKGRQNLSKKLRSQFFVALPLNFHTSTGHNTGDSTEHNTLVAGEAARVGFHVSVVLVGSPSFQGLHGKEPQNGVDDRSSFLYH